MSKELMQEAFPEMQTEIKKAQRYTQKGELIEAETIYHELLNQQQNYAPALYGLAELADIINDQEVREDLLRRAIAEVKSSEDRIKKSLVAIWLTDLAEVLLKLNRPHDANECITESERIIKENLAGE